MRFADARRFSESFFPEQILFHEPLGRYTTFGIGGPADVLVKALDVADLRKAVEMARNLKVRFLVLGGGSNVLIRDRGFRGVVILNRAAGVSFLPECPPPILDPVHPDLRPQG
ncbi:MAG: FAD-binding protein, partial [Kiritimatiellaeota bacterium]|nr:FAD-binding protein [Kiritimatiellota bacterium]